MDEKVIIQPNFQTYSINRIKDQINKLRKVLYCFILIFFIINSGIIGFILINSIYKRQIELNDLSNEALLKMKSDLYKKISDLEYILKGNSTKNINLNESNITFNEDLIFNQSINDRYIKEQLYFCENQNIFYNKEFEDKIRIESVSILDKKYNMYIYKRGDEISNYIIRSKYWEKEESKNIIKALNYYSEKKNITIQDIYVLDIGANIGWYSILLGKYGFNIISFEPSQLNNYILKKNYCLNKEINLTIINKGLYTEEKKCDLFNINRNEGNGLVICEPYNDTYRPDNLYHNKTGEITLTKLSNYIPFLSEKNLVMIKIDIEGSEAKAIEGGIELITKYHIPFIFLEFSPSLLKLHHSDPKQFLQLFIDNGYKISLSNFIEEKYKSLDNILSRPQYLLNLYLVYSKIFE